MAHRSAARLLAVAGLLVLVTLDVVLFPPVLRTVESVASPRAATTAGRPATTPTRSAGGHGVGTYWACWANESDSGTVAPNASPPPGAVSSPLCDSTYGESRPGQRQPRLPSGIEVRRVPVGTFRAFVDCGTTVVNIVDPYDAQASPDSWSGDHEVLFDANWNQVNSRTC